MRTLSNTDLLSIIGNTPLVELANLDTGKCRLFAKLEFLNPGGSIKDRIALSMIQSAEASGELKPGATIVEATAGNTGLGLALVATQKHYPLVVVLPDKMSLEKINTLRSMGAEVIITRSDVGKGHPEYYQDLARSIAAERGGFFVNQFGNPANVAAHFKHTGPEIWEQTGGHVDAFVCGVGSGGTLSGIGGYLKSVASNVDIVLGDPVGSVLAGYIETGQIGEAGRWLVEGIGEDFIPDICDLSLVDEAYSISDQEAFTMVRTLLTREGIMAGTSSGVLLASALKYCAKQTEEKHVVTLLPDNGARYISKVYNDDWMLDQGFIARPTHHDLRDLIVRRHQERETVFVTADDHLQTALNRAKLHSISQLPVLENGKVVGIIDEWDMMQAVMQNSACFDETVNDYMTCNPELIDYRSSLDELNAVIGRDHVAIVMDGDNFLGIITRIDIINYLRR